MEFIKELAEEYCVKNIPNLKDMHLTTYDKDFCYDVVAISDEEIAPNVWK